MPKWTAALKAAGYPANGRPAKVNWFMAELILVIMVIYVTMVYGPIAAFLVEMFPTKIRYTSMSLPYHIGNGWFGGMLPLLATAIVAATGDIYAGLWYPIVVAVMTLVIGAIFLRGHQGRRYHQRFRCRHPGQQSDRLIHDSRRQPPPDRTHSTTDRGAIRGRLCFGRCCPQTAARFSCRGDRANARSGGSAFARIVSAANLIVRTAVQRPPKVLLGPASRTCSESSTINCASVRRNAISQIKKQGSDSKCPLWLPRLARPRE